MSESETSGTEAPAASPQIINDLDVERLRRGAAETTITMGDDRGAEETFRRILAGLGMTDPPPMIGLINVVLGMAVGRVLYLSGHDHSLTRERCFAIVDVVCDPHRENLVGRGYMFRVNPALWDRFFGGAGAEFRDELDYAARQIRSVAMEFADNVKDDKKAVTIAKATIELVLATM